MSRFGFCVFVGVTLAIISATHAALQDPTTLTLSIGSSEASIDSIVGNADYLFAAVAYSETSVSVAVDLYQIDPESLSTVNSTSLPATTFPTMLLVDPTGALIVAISQTDYNYDNTITVFDATTLAQKCQTTLPDFPVEIPPFFVSSDLLVFGSPQAGTGFPVLAIGDCVIPSYQPSFINTEYNYWSYVYGIADPSGAQDVFYSLLNDFYTEPYVGQVNFSYTGLNVTQFFPAYSETSSLSAYSAKGATYVAYVNDSNTVVEIDMTTGDINQYPVDLPEDSSQTPYSFAAGPYVYAVSYGGKVQNGTLSQLAPNDEYSVTGTAPVPYNDQLLNEESVFAVAGGEYLFFITDPAKLTVQRYTIS